MSDRKRLIRIIILALTVVLVAAAIACAVQAVVGLTIPADAYRLRLDQSTSGNSPLYRLYRTAEDGASVRALERVDFALFAMTDTKGNLHLKGAYVLYKFFLFAVLTAFALTTFVLWRDLGKGRAMTAILRRLGWLTVLSGTVPYLLYFVARWAMYGRVYTTLLSLFGWVAMGAGLVLVLLGYLGETPQGNANKNPLAVGKGGQNEGPSNEAVDVEIDQAGTVADDQGVAPHE